MKGDENSAPDPDVEDVAFMLSVKAGNMVAFEALVERHQHSVVGTVAKMLGNDSDSEDIAQQVFVRVWRSASRYEPTAKFKTWLMTITRNLVFNEMRRRKKFRFFSLDAEPEDGPKPELEDARQSSPAREALDTELVLAVDAAIAGLPEPQRTAIILRRYEEMAYEDIAQVLHMSVPAVKSVLFRARAALKEKLKNYLED